MYLLILFAVLIDGTTQTLAAEHTSLKNCEAAMEKVVPLVKKQPAVDRFVITCQQPQKRDEV